MLSCDSAFQQPFLNHEKERFYFTLTAAIVDLSVVDWGAALSLPFSPSLEQPLNLLNQSQQLCRVLLILCLFAKVPPAFGFIFTQCEHHSPTGRRTAKLQQIW